MRPLILALVLTMPQLAQQQCSDCFGSPTFWERQEQRETRDRLQQLELEEQVRRLDPDRPRGRDPMTTDFPTFRPRCTAFWC